MTCLLCPFLYSLPPISSFLDLVAMAALPPSNTSAQEDIALKPLPAPLVFSFFLITLFFFFFHTFGRSVVPISPKGTEDAHVISFENYSAIDH
jgi:hypothetical protein